MGSEVEEGREFGDLRGLGGLWEGGKGHKQEWLFTGRCWMYTGMLLIAVEGICFSRTLPHRMENTGIPSKKETREIFCI